MEKQNFEELYKKLEEEKSETTLKDLEIHQKRRAIILVSETLDIVKVGTHIALDDKTIIQTWFCNYKGPNKIEFIGWGDKEDAINEKLFTRVTKNNAIHLNHLEETEYPLIKV